MGFTPLLCCGLLSIRIGCQVERVFIEEDWLRPVHAASPECGRNSMVECQLPKLKVAGSSPVARSNPNLHVFHQTSHTRTLIDGLPVDAL